MTSCFQFMIPGRVPVKKNTQRIIRKHGHIRAIYSARFTEWNRVALFTLKQAWKRDPIRVPCEMRITFYFKNRSGEADLSNLIEGPQDALTQAAVIVDDNLITMIRAQKIFSTKEEPRVEIELIADETQEVA